MASNGRRVWMTEMLDAALGQSIMEPADVTQYATPDLLAKHLPADVMSRVLQAALAAGAMTPASMLETLAPEVLTEHMPHDVLWSALETVAKRAGLPDGIESGTGASDANRRFLRKALESGLSNECLSPQDIVNHFDPMILATHLPVELKAKLLSAGLAANALNPQLVLDTIGVEDMSTQLPLKVLWDCVQAAAVRALGGGVVAEKVETQKSGKAAKANTKAGKNKGKAKTGETTKSAAGDEVEEGRWAADEDFEVLEESDAVGVGDILATDWVSDEQTDTGAEAGNGRR